MYKLYLENDADVIEKTDKQQSTLKKLLFIRE